MSSCSYLKRNILDVAYDLSPGGEQRHGTSRELANAIFLLVDGLHRRCKRSRVAGLGGARRWSADAYQAGQATTKMI